MITVMELLSHPLFHNFHLVGNTSGLGNTIMGTAIFDWETKEDIEKTFAPGEFVMTTLSIAKGNAAYAEEYLRILIENKVAAIAIKAIHHDHLSQEIIDYANSFCIPIFFFKDTFIDDLIYVIKNALVTDDLNLLSLKKIRDILLETSDENTKESAMELNPFFYDNCICCCCIPKNLSKEMQVLDHYYSFYHELPHSQICEADSSYLVIKGNRAIIILFTGIFEGPKLQERLITFLSRFKITEKNFRVGISTPKNDLTQLRFALLESIFSALTCVMDNETLLEFKNIGVNQLLMPAYSSHWTHNYYDNFNAKLQYYDKKHNSNLHETLLQYVKSGGDIVLTAEKLFQHSNTIRYRLGRIKDILEINETTDTYTQLYIYARLHEIFQIFQAGDLV